MLPASLFPEVIGQLEMQPELRHELSRIVWKMEEKERSAEDPTKKKRKAVVHLSVKRFMTAAARIGIEMVEIAMKELFEVCDLNMDGSLESHEIESLLHAEATKALLEDVKDFCEQTIGDSQLALEELEALGAKHAVTKAQFVSAMLNLVR